MPFEDLSYQYNFVVPDLPVEWLPLLHLYDPDLPFFPVYYFHVLPEDFPRGQIPDFGSRAYGFIERLWLSDSMIIASVICNKDLNAPENASFRHPVEKEIHERLGISNPLNFNEISSAFLSPFDDRNQLLVELWNKIVSDSLGGSLPFGRFYDPVFGLIRITSTFNPPGGRKGELIQTHYFLSRFGIRIPVTLNAPGLSFYLLPTLDELRDLENTLSIFPKFKALCEAAEKFCSEKCTTISYLPEHLPFSKLQISSNEKLKKETFLGWVRELPFHFHEPLIQCFNAFDKGPQRTVIFLLSLYDLRYRKLEPENFTADDFGLIYSELKGSYQSPKVLNLYAQQCFGNRSAFPRDTWMETFMKAPLQIKEASSIQELFKKTCNLGKMERLLWLAAQARKVHSPLCNDILWCTKFNSTGKPRGPNPLSCCACSPSFRSICPGYNRIKDKIISFNQKRSRAFEIYTTKRDNVTRGQQFEICEGEINGKPIHDDFTPVDVPEAFKPFPQPDHGGEDLILEGFIKLYSQQ